MVAVIVRLIAGAARSSALLELIGAVLIIAAVFALADWRWGMLTIGITLLLKSAEVDITRTNQGDRQ